MKTSMFSLMASAYLGIMAFPLLAQDPGIQSEKQIETLFKEDATRGIGGIRTGSSALQTGEQTNSQIVVEQAQPDSSGDSATEQSIQTQQRGQVFQNVRFLPGSYALQRESFAQLDEIGKAIAGILSTDPSAVFVIESHTDNQGSRQGNLELSNQRAGTVKNYLVQRFQMDAGRIVSVGYGDSQPIASNDTPNGREANARIVILKN